MKNELSDEKIFLMNGQIMNMIALVVDDYDNSETIVAHLVSMLIMAYGLEVNMTFEDE